MFTWGLWDLLRIAIVILSGNILLSRSATRPAPTLYTFTFVFRHYHSMKVFSYYKVINSDNQVLAVGLKASFCLEDNVCKPGFRPHFRCSTTLSTKGDQGKPFFSHFERLTTFR
ncbi:uncharacterized protein DEA37_0014668 [Paragonimus westermani]|uniref:Uncharacterized protein n=1 Tax=Paragonimus westermani TaxID=34504 RepID=A0A5J4N4B3_9TREM|nr:uncharacterized protein DEA37_0014668 [Paragonimus westermani]